MMYGEITSVCFAIHTEHMKALCRKKVVFLMITLWYTKQLEFKGLKCYYFVLVWERTQVCDCLSLSYLFSLKVKRKQKGSSFPFECNDLLLPMAYVTSCFQMLHPLRVFVC
jgi:hypothetical protein